MTSLERTKLDDKDDKENENILPNSKGKEYEEVKDLLPISNGEAEEEVLPGDKTYKTSLNSSEGLVITLTVCEKWAKIYKNGVPYDHEDDKDAFNRILKELNLMIEGKNDLLDAKNAISLIDENIDKIKEQLGKIKELFKLLPYTTLLEDENHSALQKSSSYPKYFFVKGSDEDDDDKISRFILGTDLHSPLTRQKVANMQGDLDAFVPRWEEWKRHLTRKSYCKVSANIGISGKKLGEINQGLSRNRAYLEENYGKLQNDHETRRTLIGDEKLQLEQTSLNQLSDGDGKPRGTLAVFPPNIQPESRTSRKPKKNMLPLPKPINQPTVKKEIVVISARVKANSEGVCTNCELILYKETNPDKAVLAELEQKVLAELEQKVLAQLEQKELEKLAEDGVLNIVKYYVAKLLDQCEGCERTIRPTEYTEVRVEACVECKSEFVETKYTLFVVKAEMFENAIRETRTVELTHTNIFRGNIRMFLRLPVYKGGYIHQKDEKRHL